jgi:hypothetical protein
MTNNEIVNLVGDLALGVVYGGIAVLRPAIRSFELLLLARGKRFCSWIRRCSLRLARPIEHSHKGSLDPFFGSNTISLEFAVARAQSSAGSSKVFLPFRFG